MPLRAPIATLATILGLTGLAATGAQAATVDVRDGRAPTTGSRVPVAHFQAAPGERNDVTIVGSEATTIRVTDSGAPLTAGAGCTQVDANTAECVKPPNPAPNDYPWLHYVEAELGDGDDVLHGGPYRVGITADGGPGADLLEGSEIIDDRLDGGGGGIDRLVGGEGNDVLTDGDDPAAPDDDRLDGGPGTDRILYATRTAAVTVVLTTATAGQAGEADAIAGFEEAVGGEGDDELEGTGTENLLVGGSGRDHLDGLAGDDRLEGDVGRDRVHGGAGADFVDGGTSNDELRGDRGDDTIFGPRFRDDFSCGPGADVIADPTTYVVVPRSCEGMRFTLRRATTMTIDPRPRALSGGRVRFRLGCPLSEEMDGLCPISQRGRITLDPLGHGVRPIGTSRLRWTLDRRDDPILAGNTVRLNRLGRRLARRPAGVKTQITVKLDGLGTLGWTLAHLRARR